MKLDGNDKIAPVPPEQPDGFTQDLLRLALRSSFGTFKNVDACIVGGFYTRKLGFCLEWKDISTYSSKLLRWVFGTHHYQLTLETLTPAQP